MAAVFYKAINQAASDGRLVVPGDFDQSTTTVCDKFAGTGTDAGGLTQRGVGEDDGIYYHKSQGMDVSWNSHHEASRVLWLIRRLKI